MTIEFNCPNCGALIAFDGKYAGRRAKCLTCGQKLIIPAASFTKPEKIKPPAEPKGEPTPGFYRAVFIDTWKIFIHPKSVTPLAFVIAVVCFKFFLAQACCLNYVATVVIWGWLFGFYLSLIYDTAFDEDVLPEIHLGSALEFVWNILEPFFIFFYTLFLVELPFIIAFALARGHGVTPDNLWTGATPLHRFLQALVVGGLFVFPAAVLTTAVGKDFFLLRPDYLLAPIVRAFIPYMLAVSLLAAACLLEYHTTQNSGEDTLTLTRDLGLNLAVQLVAIFAMRSVGLLYRHYACYFKW
jgi:hypothetical protein